jgi:hypothetical protein
MATTKQPAAGRRKAQKTTGQGTAESKATSPVKAAKRNVHVNKVQILGDESAEGLAFLSAEYHELYNPENSIEHALVDALVNNEWSLRRLRRTEIEIWDRVSNQILAKKGPNGVVTAGETFAAGSAEFVRHQRTVDACERNYFRALKELQRIEAARTSRRVLQFPQPPKGTEPPSSE